MSTVRNHITKSGKFYTDEQINAKFLELLPLITKTARIAFAKYDTDRREEAVQNVHAMAFYNLKRLAEKGRLEDAKATPLAWYAIKRHSAGRVFGVQSRSTDVMSKCCQLLGRAQIKHYGAGEYVTDTFESTATALDARYPVDRTVQFKIDFFEDWYQRQSPRDKEIIRDLAMGYTTNEVAKKFGVSAGLISQYRKKYAESWYTFISDKREKPDLIDELKRLAEKETA